MKYNVLDISRFVLNYTIQKGTPISNLVLQKILYYIQANYLVKERESCFDEKIINWAYGPVVIEAYEEYREYGRNKIDKVQKEYVVVDFDEETKQLIFLNKEFDKECILEKDRNFIKEIVDIYTTDQYCQNPFLLVKKTHNEEPWLNSIQNDVISQTDIKEYYDLNQNKLVGD